MKNKYINSTLISDEKYKIQLGNILKNIEDTSFAFKLVKKYNPYAYLQTYSLLNKSLYIPFKKNIDEQIVELFKPFLEISKIYFKEYETLIDIKIIIKMDTYDYDLIDKILNKAEFPLKEENSNKLINVDYIPEIAEETNQVNPFMYSLIYDKNLIITEASYLSEYIIPDSSVSYSNP